MLKLFALDEQDLAVISAHLQDAVVRIADLAYLPSQKRFVAVLNRFDWENCTAMAPGKGKRGKTRYQRHRTALRFDRVLASQVKNINLSAKDTVLSLLAIQYQPTAPETGPEGYVFLTFAGQGTIRLQVECIEAELSDLGGSWETTRRPHHPEVEDS